MLALPPGLTQKFESLLEKRSVPNNRRADYHKWLRYYLDFCHKYLGLQEARQFFSVCRKIGCQKPAEAQHRQARQAIALYYRGIVDQAIPIEKTQTGTISHTNLNNKNLSVNGNHRWTLSSRDPVDDECVRRDILTPPESVFWLVRRLRYQDVRITSF